MLALVAEPVPNWNGNCGPEKVLFNARRLVFECGARLGATDLTLFAYRPPSRPQGSLTTAATAATAAAVAARPCRRWEWEEWRTAAASEYQYKL